jgi:hypothetical protein
LPDAITDDLPAPTNAELVHLRIRVIALESLMVTLLAEASDGQRDLARDMAATISPRQESARHSVTIHATRQMLNMSQRAEHAGLQTLLPTKLRSMP